MILHELLLADEPQQIELGEDGLLYKTIIREGHFSSTPTNKGVQNKPFKVVGSGASDPANQVISIDDLISSFEDGAFQHVTVPIGHPKDKKEALLNNTGYVRRLIKGTDSKGRQVVKAGIEFTDKDVEKKAREGSIPDVSSGIFFNFTNGSKQKTYPVALNHTALTPTPFVDDMDPFSTVAASSDEVESVEGVAAYTFADTEVDLEEAGEVVWNGERSYGALRSKIQSLFDKLSTQAKTLGSEVYYYVVDVSKDDKVLVENGESEKFVVPYTISEDDEVSLASADKWIEAKTAMVAASDEESTEESTPEPTQESDPDAQQQETDEQSEETVDAEDSTTTLKISAEAVTLADENRTRLEQARNQRLAKANIGEITMARTQSETVELKLDGVPEEKAQEIQAAFEATQNALAEAQEKADNAKKESHKQSVEAEVEGLKDIGLDKNPGMLKLVRRVLLADDGEPTAILAEDENDKEEVVTASDIVRSFIEYLPKSEDGKLQLSAQALAVEAGDPPAADATEENQSAEDQLREAYDVLGRHAGIKRHKPLETEAGE